MKKTILNLLHEWRREVIICITGPLLWYLVSLASQSDRKPRSVEVSDSLKTVRAFQDTIRAKDAQIDALRVIVQSDSL